MRTVTLKPASGGLTACTTDSMSTLPWADELQRDVDNESAHLERRALVAGGARLLGGTVFLFLHRAEPIQRARGAAPLVGLEPEIALPH
jgi:hypothetical protein